MRTKYAAGNWKMNTSPREGAKLAEAIRAGMGVTLPKGVEVILAPPFTHLGLLAEKLAKSRTIHLAAQNVHQEDSGAYTGEISAKMLLESGCNFCLVGHSERRHYFGETNELLLKKVLKLLENHIQPIYCLGETLAEREANKTFEVVGSQLREGLFGLSPLQFSQVIVAYEPVWAIGTGKVASPAQAQEIHAFLRGLILEKYGTETAQSTSILYGGSVSPANARELFSQPDIDGGLVGGASLKANSFVEIIRSF